MHFDLISLITTVGYFGVFGIVFAESGLLIGFFLPGDSLLFTAGFLASQNILDIRILTFGCFLSAVLGDSVGYAFGHRVGKRLFQREDSILFHKDNLLRAKAFYERYGKKTIILARFIPIVRTFAPIVAGIGDMHYPTFLSFNIIGGALWAMGLTIAGYWLGNIVPDADRYLLPIVLAIIIASVSPAFLHILREPRRRHEVVSIMVRLLRLLKRKILG
jgi:membrane-associated protein